VRKYRKWPTFEKVRGLDQTLYLRTDVFGEENRGQLRQPYSILGLRAMYINQSLNVAVRDVLPLLIHDEFLTHP